jgi:HEAT repeat protein
LGFGNNPAAIPHLIGFTEDVREYVRQAAISSLGILQATDQLDHLIAISKGNGNWADRAMALKALGDLGTPESLAYLGEIRDGFKGQTTNNAVWSTSIINLYLD